MAEEPTYYCPIHECRLNRAEILKCDYLYAVAVHLGSLCLEQNEEICKPKRLSDEVLEKFHAQSSSKCKPDSTEPVSIDFQAAREAKEKQERKAVYEEISHLADHLNI